MAAEGLTLKGGLPVIAHDATPFSRSRRPLRGLLRAALSAALRRVLAGPGQSRPALTRTCHGIQCQQYPLR